MTETTHLGQVGVEEQLEIIVNDSLAHGVDVGQSVPSSLEGEEADETDDLRELGHVRDALLHLREEGGDLLELLQPEESVAGGVLEQHKVWGHHNGSVGAGKLNMIFLKGLELELFCCYINHI